MVIDRLIDGIKFFQNPTAVGLDTDLKYLPQEMLDGVSDIDSAADAIFDFNKEIIDSVSDIVPCVKVQAAYYEMYGYQGMRTFSRTIQYARGKGMTVIADVKRNDIGSTAKCYADAYLGFVEICGKKVAAFDSDFITVNAYLGSDGIKPFTDACAGGKKGIFVLVKTSNPSGGELQDKQLSGNGTVYEFMGDYVAQWGENIKGRYGYSAVGAVVGATHSKQAENLRKRLPSVFFLIPGYGAQGAGAKDLSVCFDKNGLGGIVNSSRGILLAYRNQRYKGMSFGKAARRACEDMRSDLVAEIDGL